MNVGYYLGPKIKQDMKLMREYTNEDCRILTSVGWVDLKTNEATKLTVLVAPLQQSMLTGLAVSGLKMKLQTPSDKSRLMGEPP